MAEKKKSRSSSQDVAAVIASRAKSKTLSATDVKNIQRFVSTVEKTISQFRTATMQGW
jgi:flagellar biosynthesis chaperone FliJ